MEINLDYKTFCDLYYKDAEKVADITVAEHIKRHGKLNPYIDVELAKDLGIGRGQAKEFIDNYFAVYSGVKSFFDENVRHAEENGYIKTIFDRRRKILAINSKNKMEKEGAIRVAKNSPIQGSAADIVKQAMLDVTSALKSTGSKARLLLQVHDELIFECPDDETEISNTIALIRDKMEHAVKLRVPLRVSIECDKNWGCFH